METFDPQPLPELALSLPEDCSRKLNEIISRHRNYMTAKANRELATKKEDLDKLLNEAKCLKEDRGVCPLCLDTMTKGQKVVELSCGHCFHAGDHNLDLSCDKQKLETVDSLTGKKRKRDVDACKGVLYWLKNNHSCPHCRQELPTELPEPSESEKLLLPLLHRQNRLIARQMEIIKSQKQQLDAMLKRIGPFQEKTSTGEISPSPLETRKTFSLPRMSWQNSMCPLQQTARKAVLKKITDVTLRDIVVRGATDETSKKARLHELATKIEFILYCCSPSYEVYCDDATLRERTLNTVKNLADRARALKLQTTSI